MKSADIRGEALKWACDNRLEFGCLAAIIMEIEFPLRTLLGFIRPPLENAVGAEESVDIPFAQVWGPVLREAHEEIKKNEDG